MCKQRDNLAFENKPIWHLKLTHQNRMLNGGMKFPRKYEMYKQHENMPFELEPISR